MAKSKIDPNYYEETDFGDLMETSKRKKIIRPKNKRITMNISEEIYFEANVLDNFMNMGYQNVLKAAMTLGLEQLNEKINKGKKLNNRLIQESV